MTVVAMIANDIWSEWDFQKPLLDYTSAEDRTLTIEAETRTITIEEES